MLLKISTLISTLLLSICSGHYIFDTYDIPEPTIEVFRPKGFRVSINDTHSDKIEVFAVDGNVFNRVMRGSEPGEFFKLVFGKKNGKWIFEDRNTRLNVGDEIHYSLFMIKDGLNYTRYNGHYIVTGTLYVFVLGSW